MSGLLARTRPELVRQLRARGVEIPERRVAVEIPERPKPARWIVLAQEREHGLARDESGRLS
jgi:hypothetical protein